MRLIDADALKEKCFGKRGGLIHTSDVDNMPTIEITRCRDCKYWYRMTRNIGKCERVLNANCGIWDSDDYCSYAKRREEDEE